MEVLFPRCAGLDVHKDTVVVCARLSTEDGVSYEQETFGTTTSALLALCDWLTERQVTNVAMEATGIYWKPVWHILEGSFKLTLANAAHVKNVPGRKTDINDATWLAELLAHGLVSGGFVPETRIQDLRALTRTRRQLVRDRTRHVQRLQKVLEDANIKLSSFVSDVVGQSGRRVLAAIIDGEEEPDKLVQLMNLNRLKASQESLKAALQGHVRKHHRFMLKLHLDQLDAINSAIQSIEEEVSSVLDPFREAAELLTTAPGIAENTASTIVAEIGTDMTRFPSAGHLLSWARICPRNDQSAGKRRSTRIMPGRDWLKPVLVQAAWAAVAKKDSYLRAKYFRLRARRGSKKAIVAVAASLLTSIYYMLRDGMEYQDLGPHHFKRLDREKYANRLVKRLRDCGYDVTIAKAA